MNMCRFAVVLIFFISVCSAVPPLKFGGRIVGGEDIPIEEVPYQISLQINGRHQCGGSLIASNYVITAAHCTEGLTEKNLTVRVATSTRDSDGQVIEVKRFVAHPEWNNVTIQNDIAVLELEDSLTLGDKIQTIALPSPSQSWPSGTEALASGWGLLSEESTALPVNLQGVTVEIVDQTTCDKAYGSIASEVVLCAGPLEGGKGVCSADSGGPLQVDGVLAGVVSFSTGCARAGYPGGYANVAAFRDFIEEVTGL